MSVVYIFVMISLQGKIFEGFKTNNFFSKSPILRTSTGNLYEKFHTNKIFNYIVQITFNVRFSWIT